ncbi:hypothetical protein Acr_27g0001740 [Actinidia rufa]|uniref:Retrotransposon gag domain-containing protein n=1 Tax=Actinidia rufa TaxID=165716 RepID=A0A7J0H648_9ERIC|nr:hypothetical protein Acr_27g0001740 [Actinidia rufa]
MHLRSRNLPRPSASSPPGNRSHPMANSGQAPDLEGLHREIHDMAEQMRIMNENNGRLMQLLAAANPPLPATPPVPDIERSRHSNRSGDRSQNISANRVGRGDAKHQARPYVKRVHRNLVKLQPGREGEGVLAEATTSGHEISPPHKRFEIWTPDSTPSTPGRMLYRLFVANFMSCRNRQKYASHLFTIHQKETESLKDFVKRFNQAILEVEDPSDKSKANKYIAAEELAEAKRRRRGKDDHKRKEPDTRRTDYREETRYKRPDLDPKRSSNRRPRTPPRRPETTDTIPEDCFQLKEARLPTFIKRGYLRKYVADRPPPNSPERRYGDNRPTAGNIQTIHGGFGSGGCSTSSRKRHARSAFRLAEEEIYNLSSPYVDHTPITFSNDDLRGLHLPHDDALVVSAVIANFNVQRILINNGSSADILFISAFQKMKVGLDKLHPFHPPLIGFGGNTTPPLGLINLPITLGTEPHQTTVWQDFIVVDCPSPYNAILGRPTLGRIKAVTSTYHLKMKFPTLTGIGEVKGDQKVARQCFISAMKVGTSVQSAQ